MAEITEELRVLVTAEVDKAIKNLNQLDRKTEKTSSDFEKLGKAIGSALLVKAAVDFGKASVRAAEDAKQKFSLLKTTIDTTGASAWTSIDAMSQMSKELSDSTNYSVSEIQSMQTVLLGFKNITGDTFKEASGAIMDMATVMGMDLKSAVQTVGKALDDPINGIDSLKRQGFAFTDAQKSMLKAMVKTGDMAGAQKIILEELATTYGGAAKAAQTSFAKLEHSMDELKESVGNILTPMLADIAEETVELLEKFNSLDAGTQRVIITATSLAAATPAVITALGGIKTALVALGATAPQLVAIGAGITAITAISTKIVNSRNAFKDLTTEIAKTRTSTNALLDSYAGGNGAKKLDEETTKKLIDLYPQLAGEINAYSTSVDDAKKAVENLVNQKLLDAESSGIKKYMKKLEGVADLELKVAKYKSHNNEMDALRAKEIESKDIPAVRKLAEEQRSAINERLKNLNKMLTYDGKIIDIPVEIKADPKGIKNGLESSDIDIKKAWQEWLSKILKVDQSLFKTGEEAANIYIDGLERSLENAEGVSEILGKKFSATDIIDSQMNEIESNINKLLNIDPPLIDSVFNLEELKQEGTALNALYEDWKKLQDAKATSVIEDLQKQIDDLSKSEFDLYLETNKLLNAPPEKIDEIREKFDELKLKSFDELGEKIGYLTQKGLESLDLFDEKSRAVIGSVVANLSNISFDTALTGFREFGRALGAGANAAESLQTALVAMAEQILNQLPTMFLQAGLQLIAQGQWPLGLGFIAAAGSTAIISGFVSGKKESEKENALGGVYGADDYRAFAKGGTFTNQIVSSPTFFRFAKGSGFGTGLMGEAGPEAVMPLTRGADGSLGVDASGIGGAGNVEVNIPVYVYSDEPVEVNDTTDEDGNRKIEVLVGSMINAHIANGKADKAMKSRYGLKVQGV
ncbi:MAG: phage tail length tape measure family protein [Treponema sp.]|nr:phage tail length tape measure family protein [Treponema sp.]